MVELSVVKTNSLQSEALEGYRRTCGWKPSEKELVMIFNMAPESRSVYSAEMEKYFTCAAVSRDNENCGKAPGLGFQKTKETQRRTLETRSHVQEMGKMREVFVARI